MLRRLSAGLAVACVAGFVLFMVPSAAATLPAGSADPTFNTGHPVDPLPEHDSAVHVVAPLPDGRIVALVGSETGSYLVFVKSNGAVERQVPEAAPGAWLDDIRVDSTGRIVAVGSVEHDQDGVTTGYPYITRFLNDGTLDTSFGDAGYVHPPEHNCSDASCYPYVLTLNGDAIDVGTFEVPPGSTNFDGAVPVVEQFLPNGAADTSFGDDGWAVLEEGFGITAMTATPQFGIAVALEDGSQPVPTVTLARLLNDGTLYTNFGTDGYLDTGHGGPDALAMQGTKIIDLSGLNNMGGTRGHGWRVTRYDVYGQTDLVFGDQGVATQSVDGLTYNVETPSIDAEGRIVVSTMELDTSSPKYPETIDLARYTPNGLVDHGFGTDGIVRIALDDYNLPSPPASTAAGILIGITSTHQGRPGYSGAIERLLSDPTEAPSSTTTTSTTTPSTTTTSTTFTTQPPASSGGGGGGGGGSASTGTTTTTAPPSTTTTTQPPQQSSGGAASAQPSFGYWLAEQDGVLHAFGNAPQIAPWAGMSVADIVATPTGQGLWIVDGVGRVGSAGDAATFGNAPALGAFESVVSMSTTPSGKGYWLFTNRGRVFAFGDAHHYGDMSAVRLNAPIIDSAATPDGRGYYLIGSDGGVFTFGDATFRGSTGNLRLNRPVRAIVPTPTGNGYWLVANDGGVFTFGDATYRGSAANLRLNAPVVGMVPYGSGYLMVASDGGVFDFSDRPFNGSLGANPPSSPIVAITALP